MKKTIFRFAFLFLVAATFVACDNYKDDNEGYLSDRTPVTYFAEASYTLFVKENQTNEIKIQVGSSDIASVDRSYVVTIDGSSTAVDGTHYTTNISNLTIPAGKRFGKFTVTAGSFADADVAGRTVVFDLQSVEGSEINHRLRSTLTVIKFCPIEAPFTGDYLIEELTPFVDGPTLNHNMVVTVYNIDGSETQRGFMTANYINYCSTPNEFKFDLVCGNILIPGAGNQSNCACGGNLWFTNADVPSTFDPTDDSTFEVTFTNDAFSDCGAPVQTTYRFTKQ